MELINNPIITGIFLVLIIIMLILNVYNLQKLVNTLKDEEEL